MTDEPMSDQDTSLVPPAWRKTRRGYEVDTADGRHMEVTIPDADQEPWGFLVAFGGHAKSGPRTTLLEALFACYDCEPATANRKHYRTNTGTLIRWSRDGGGQQWWEAVAAAYRLTPEVLGMR